jgi:hypothetical protein
MTLAAKWAMHMVVVLVCVYQPACLIVSSHSVQRNPSASDMAFDGPQPVTQATDTSETWWTRFVDYLLFTISNAIYSGAPLFFWVRPRWSVSQMPSQAGKVSDSYCHHQRGLTPGQNSTDLYRSC